MTRYYDASAIVKRYFEEEGSGQVRRWVRTGDVATSRLTVVEVHAALVRLHGKGHLSRTDFGRLSGSLERDAGVWSLVELDEGISDSACALSGEHGLRAGDAVQLASGLHVDRRMGGGVPFVVFDRSLAAAARREGLTVLGV